MDIWGEEEVDHIGKTIPSTIKIKDGVKDNIIKCHNGKINIIATFHRFSSMEVVESAMEQAQPIAMEGQCLAETVIEREAFVLNVLEEALIIFQEDLAENVKEDIGKDEEDIEALVVVLVTNNIGDNKEVIIMEEVLVVQDTTKEDLEVAIIMVLKGDIKVFKEEVLDMVLIKVDSEEVLEAIGDISDNSNQ